MNTQPTVLILDDDVDNLESLQRILQNDFDILTAGSVKDAENLLQKEWVQIILCDHRMQDVNGVDFLKKVRDTWPEIIRMIISGCQDSRDIIDAVNVAGIYQYITKPWHPEQVILTLKNAVHLFQLNRQNELLSIELKLSPQKLELSVNDKRELLRSHYGDDDDIVRGPDSCMNGICRKIRQVSPFDVSVLLTGESGTGKELAARALHCNSLRWEKSFVVENCAALPDALLESELFGFKRGAFTGAIEDRTGLFERASGGTVFLDEIGEVSPAFQVKLLRVVQEGEVRPLGCGKTRKVDVRIIAATNRDLEADVREGRFREDLYYRLAGVTIRMPPLRDRVSDIPVLARALLQRATRSLGKPAADFTDEALACLQQYHWPGNVRELQNEIQHMLILAPEDILGADLISPRILRAGPQPVEQALEMVAETGGTLKNRIQSLEASILRESMIRNRWNKSRAAKELGLSRVGLRSKLERYGLEKFARPKSVSSSEAVA